MVNPIRYAIALRYDDHIDEVPITLAKGIDVVALKIIEFANINNIPIIPNPPLARSLYVATDINSYIPEKLYQAVAYVWKNQRINIQTR